MNQGSSGVSPSKTLNQVSDAEARDICYWQSGLITDLEPSREDICTSFAVSTTTTTEACEQFRDQCLEAMEQEPEEPEEEEEDQCASVTASQVSCNATVGDYESCLKAAVQLSTSVRTDVSCAAPGETPETPTALPDECDNLQTKCPEFLGQIMGGGLDG